MNNKLLHINRIKLTDGSILENRDALITNGFLIVSAESDKESPTWYNLDGISVLEGVNVEQTKSMRIGVL